MGFECSAYYNRNINKVLHCLQSAVLHPVGPLYSLRDRDLTERFKKILTRVFRVLDQDFDGELSDVEISKLQERVFDSSLNAEHIKRIKEIIKIELEEYDHMNKISLKGFIALNKKCIEMKNMQICWSILHNFGYN
jgi:Ras family protein T1